MVEMNKETFIEMVQKQMKKMEGKQRYVVNGMGFPQLLTIVFIILKLTDYIDWSWWWVLSPIWLPIAVILGLCIGLPIIFVVGAFLFFAIAEGIDWLVKKGRN